MSKDNLGDRMKGYENVSRTYLTRRTPVIIRIDGCHFHTFTKDFAKPFDDVLMATMQKTMLELCRRIQGCVLGYTQSDEITLVLCDYKHLDSQAWFDNNIQKMSSVAASIATQVFNQFFRQYSDPAVHAYMTAWIKGATFDARCFNIPKEEVCNCLIWRQQDAIRNSINMVGRFHFSHKEMNGKNTKEVKEKLLNECGVDWDAMPIMYQRGVCCIKSEGGWIIDRGIPLFTKYRDYVDKRIIFEDVE